MKWFCSTNEQSIKEFKYYQDILCVAFKSSIGLKDVERYLIYNGNENIDIIKKLKDYGVIILQHEVKLSQFFKEYYKNDNGKLRIALGAYGRVDIPIICKKFGFTDKFVLYTDCDVMIKSFDGLTNQTPNYFSCSPEFSKTPNGHVNTGVMYINVNKMAETYDFFIDFCKNNQHLSAFDQGCINQFYKNKWDNLPIEYNWKPYWGYNEDAKIIHFHGPKPEHAKHDKKTLPQAYQQLMTTGYELYCKEFYKILGENNE